MSDFDSHIIQEASGTHFKCDKCNKSTRLFRPAKVVLFVCPNCRKIHSKENYGLYSQIPNQPTLKTRKDLPALGATGKLGERTFTVIGIANKRENHNVYGVWKEIVLLDDLGDIHFLNSSYGNYTMLSEDHVVNADAMLHSMTEPYVHDSIKFKFFATYNYQTTSLSGEFHYDAIDVKNIKCYDFLSPPHIISIEQEDKKSPQVFRGRHFSRKEVADMFTDPAIENQNHEGIGMAQPFYGGLNVRRFNLLSFAFLLLIILAGVFTGNPSSIQIISVNKTLAAIASETEFVTETFRITDDAAPAYLRIHTSAGISNEWAETQIALVNESTGEEREYALGIEYYSGVDDGYSWSEGSNSGETNISAVKAGLYHLKCKVLYSTLDSDTSYRMTLNYASTSGWNIGIILFPYLGLLIVLNILKRQFERMRTGEIDNLFGSSYTE